MSKTPKIRWRESDLNELQRIINNFNARLATQQKNNPGAEYLPERAKKSEAVESIYSRKDFNRYIAKLERFTAETAKPTKKSKRGAVTTQWEHDEFLRNQKAVNRERAKLKKELEGQEVSIGGEGTGYKKAQMSDFKEVSVRPDQKKFENMSQKEWKEASKLMDARLRADYNLDKKKKMLENYIKGLIRQGYSDDLLKMIASIDPEVFYEKIDLDEFAGFAFIYDMQALKDLEESIKGAWEEYAGTATQDINIDELQTIVSQELDAGYMGRWAIDSQRTHRKRK